MAKAILRANEKSAGFAWDVFLGCVFVSSGGARPGNNWRGIKASRVGSTSFPCSPHHSPNDIKRGLGVGEEGSGEGCELRAVRDYQMS